MIKKYQTQLLQEAAAYIRNGDVPFLPITGYLSYLSTGERLSFEKAYFARRKQLAVLALAYYLEPQTDTKSLLEQVIWEVCNEFSWCLPAHIPIVNQQYIAEADCWIDLFAAETGQTLAEILELMGTDLSVLLQTRVYQEIERRILHPFERQKWDWEDKENNWSGVIGGSIGMVALAILKKNSTRQKHILQKIDKSLQAYLRGFHSDGACEEGMGYWVYGFGYYVYFAEKLAEVVGDDKYLRIPKVQAIASFPYYFAINEAAAIPFSDYQPAELPSGLISFCHKYFQVPTPSVKRVSDLNFDHCYRFAHLYRNLVWTKSIQATPRERYHYFSDVEWAVFQSETADLVFAAKGGHNEESHNHIDLGHFVFGSADELLLTDLGAGEYTKSYFDEQYRYSYFVNQALGHSIPIINGHLQQAGKLKAKDTRFDKQGNLAVFRTELASTYAQEAELLVFHRELILNPEEKSLELYDRFKMKGHKNQIIENFITTSPVKCYGSTVKIFDKQICEISLATKVELKEVIYKNHAGKSQQATLIQGFYETSEEATIGVKFRLVADKVR